MNRASLFAGIPAAAWAFLLRTRTVNTPPREMDENNNADSNRALPAISGDGTDESALLSVRRRLAAGSQTPSGC